MPHSSTTQPCLRRAAYLLLKQPDPVIKAQATQELWLCRADYTINSTIDKDDANNAPGRPERPRLIDPKDVPRRTPYTVAGHAALMHSIAHIEFNAIHLALDALWRFDGLPAPFYVDWLQVAAEEAKHFTLLSQHLQALGYQYGDFEAHNGLWDMCISTQHDIVARMALVPRTMEARGLDATPIIQAKLRKVATPTALEAATVLQIILDDEVGHVAIGNHWYRWLCEQRGLDPIALYPTLAIQHRAPKMRPPFNLAARKQAGFHASELEALTQSAE